ncbi:iron compound ABC uptake transporter substrate-binding protein [Lachnospiraceae bacterium KM106-2]|nr:iron compound ABC uptake transporter substrate-binding protein [Lachnospiraceae bacterium KM106-2]
MKKKLLALTIGIMSSVLLMGCGKETTKTDQKAVENKKEITIEHSKGTTKITTGVKKAVVFDMSIVDTMQELGIDTELAVPQDSIPTYLKEYTKDAVNAGGIKEPDMEAIYSFEPDVIFISGRQEGYYEELSKIAPTVYAEINVDNYMDDVKKIVTYVGDIFDKSDVATEKLKTVDEKTAEVQSITKNSDKNALIILTNDGSISAYGKGSRFGLIHDVLGIKPADDKIEVSTHGQEASYEYIAKVNPDVLFVVDRTAVAGGTTSAAKTLDNDIIKGTKAAKSDKIITLNAEHWYLSNGGLQSVLSMLDEVKTAIQ